MLGAAVLIIVISSKYSVLGWWHPGVERPLPILREAWHDAICLFDNGEEDRRTEHEEATKTLAPFDFAPKGFNQSAQRAVRASPSPWEEGLPAY
jgi:hypothetical protein